MKTSFATIVTLLVIGTATAAPFPKGDPKTGKALHDKAKCDACHASLMGGNASRLYTRAERKMKNADALLKQVQFCAAQVGAQWFPEDEQHVAAYLNQQYYKFQ
jgi:hypothetical protein